MELRRLEGAVSDDYRGIELVEMALRAQGNLYLVCEHDIGTAGRQAHRFEIEHAATKQPTLHCIDGQVECITPICGENDAGKMTAWGMAGNKDASAMNHGTTSEIDLIFLDSTCVLCNVTFAVIRRYNNHRPMAQSITFNRSTREIRRQNLKRQSEHQTFQFQSLTWGARPSVFDGA